MILCLGTITVVVWIAVIISYAMFFGTMLFLFADIIHTTMKIKPWRRAEKEDYIISLPLFIEFTSFGDEEMRKA